MNQNQVLHFGVAAAAARASFSAVLPAEVLLELATLPLGALLSLART